MKRQISKITFADDKNPDLKLTISFKQLTKILKKYNNESDDSKKIILRIRKGEKIVECISTIANLRQMFRKVQLLKNVVPKSISGYLIDLTNVYSKQEVCPIIGREDEIEKIWFHISQQTRNNAFLIGDIETGKTVIALEIARRIAIGECPKEFLTKRVFLLKADEISRLGAKAEADKKNGKLQIRFNQIVEDLNNFLIQNREYIVLIVDDGLYMKTDSNLIYMLQDFIKKYRIPIISTLSTEDYEEYFLKDTTISKHLNYVYVEEPEITEIRPMLEQHVQLLKEQYQINISEEMLKFIIFTAFLTNSISSNPGNIISVLNKSFLEAKRKGKSEIDKQSVLSCYDSYRNLYNKMTPEAKKETAYHETGHYVLNMYFKDMLEGRKIGFVSILPMMDFLGVNFYYEVKGKDMTYTKDQLMSLIAISMGGRVAEKFVNSKDNVGAAADLRAASSIAEAMIFYYGLSENKKFRNRSYATEDWDLKGYLISEQKKKEFDEEIQKILDEGYTMAEDILNKKRELVDVIANQLLEKEILTGEELEKIVEEYESKN